MNVLYTILIMFLPFILKAQLQVLPDHAERQTIKVVPFYDMSMGKIQTFGFGMSTYMTLNAGLKQRQKNGGGHGGLLQLLISDFTTVGLMYRYTSYKDDKSSWHVQGGIQKTADIYGLALEGGSYISPSVSLQGGVRYFPWTGGSAYYQMYGGIGLHRGAAAIGTGALAIIGTVVLAAVIGRSR